MRSRLFQKVRLTKIHASFLKPRFFSEKTPCANLIVKNVLRGNKESVTKILKTNPDLLLQNGSAMDFSGRSFTGTAFQATLCTGDIEIGKMIKEYFSFVSNHLDDMRQQFDAIFPKESGGFDAHLSNQARNTFDFAPINVVIQSASLNEVEAALAVQDNESILCRELNNFRQTFTKHSYCEKVFNPQHVLRAFEMYDTFWENTPPTDTINYVKRALVWRQILGFAQRFLPACHAQDFAYGLYDIFVNKHSCLRTFNFRYDPNYAFFPLSGPRSGIGFDVAAISGSGRGAPYCLVRGGSRLCYEAYVEQKNQAWKEYEIQLNNKGRENKL